MNDSVAQGAIRRADSIALARALSVKPLLCGVARAADVMDFKWRMLLHAGPPIPDLKHIAEPLRNSIVMAILYEGWARSAEAAHELLNSGEITLASAQDHAAAIPLADVLSESMPVLVVKDAGNPHMQAYSTINGGNGPVMRVGLCQDAVVERLRWIGEVLAPELARVLTGHEIDMIDVADQALMKGDDCHGRTAIGSGIIRDRLLALAGAGSFSDDVRGFLDTTAAFFLNPWMASLKLILHAAEGVAGSSFVTAFGGNGSQFGLQVSALPGRWFVAPAAPPFIPGKADLLDQSSGAVGDSAIVDALGFGAMAAQAYAPETWARVGQVCHERHLAFPVDLLQDTHPLFRRATALRTGLTVQRARLVAQTPVISIGVLDRSGDRGRLEGGIFFSPRAAFDSAWAELEKHCATA